MKLYWENFKYLFEPLPNDTGELLTQIDDYKQEIALAEGVISDHEQTLKEYENEIDELNELLLNYAKEDAESKYWNNHYTQKVVKYKARDGLLRDPRSFLITDSNIIKYELPSSLTRQDLSDDERALAILKWVHKTILYKSDSTNFGQNEYWQHAEETITRKTADCEDGILLIKSIALQTGIPDYKMKICCGDVKGGGHAYGIYLASDKEWYVLDWCYWYEDSVNNFLHKTHKEQLSEGTRYKTIWWTFNQYATYSNKTTTINKGEK